MKKNFIFIALAALILPVLLRGLWFYRGIAQRPEIATPDYKSFSAPEAPYNPSDLNANDIHQYDGMVLIDAIHGNQFMMTEIESLTDAIKQRGGQIDLLNDATLLEYKLKYAHAFVTISPSVVFTADEIRILKNFADRGGKILVFTDATRYSLYYDYVSGNPITYGDVNAVNPLLTPFGISINNDYLYNLEKNEGNFRNVYFDEFAKSELTFGLKEVALYGTHSVESPSGLILLRGAESTFSSANDANNPAQGGAALSADGNVLAFGDFTFMSSPYSNYTDNAALIGNLADFALSSTQKVTLNNFPFIYSGNTVRVYLSTDLTKTAEMVAALGRFQAALQTINIKIEFVDEMPKDGDAVIFGTFVPTDELTPLMNKFDLTIEEGSEFINVPGFGDIGVYGNSVLLFDATNKGNKLALLANSPEDLITVMDTLTSGYLTGCLMQDNTAICSVGFGGTYSEDATATDTANGEATPEPVVTPQG
ncbi:MAG: hypothetical protein U0V02_05300 [Anaerolineales bacterium]